MPTVEALQAEVSRLESELMAARVRLREAREAAAEFKVGDVVEAQQIYGRLNRTWQPAIVRRVRFDWSSTPYYFVSFQKDGDWSKVVADCVEVRAAQ